MLRIFAEDLALEILGTRLHSISDDAIKISKDAAHAAGAMLGPNRLADASANVKLDMP